MNTQVSSPFRSSFSEDIFNYKYRHKGAETWGELASTLVEDVCRDFVPADVKEAIREIIATMKFIPGGRYLYYAGRPFKALNNCFAAGTNVLTDEGWRPVDKLGEANVFSPVTGTFLPATFNAHGEQEVFEYTFAPLRGKSKVTYKVQATEDHKWLLKNGKTTESLSVGDLVPSNTFSVEEDELGFVHGFIFGDGTRNGQLRLCCDKDILHLPRLAKLANSVTYPDFADGDPLLYFSQKVDWKNLPSEGATPSYIAGFLRGWIAADGCKAQRSIHSVKKENLEWFAKYAAYAGLTVTGNLRSQVRDVKIGSYEYKDHEIFIQNFCEGFEWHGFKVVDKVFKGTQKVYCPFEPKHNQIVIDHNIHTYQCFLLKAEVDSREDWAELSWKSESCLATGGGIGVDYSVYRPRNSPLKRTGGVASGPVSKMRMINEIGREVMQGGSRRSAIYASLNWRHPDSLEFLNAKNWNDMPAGNSGLTLGELKEQDFNFPCPLDMTNISLNYDNAFLSELLEGDGQLPKMFLDNCKQAAKTGEPGLSFNFGAKENETLRNACCEVTSEDDSDVCNLGSVNLSRIASKEELYQVSYLGGIFLLCGTLVADLPYPKVKKVREKNRRLGLGLMGVHEWLISKGYRYEVNDEFKEWLGEWKRGSEVGAKEYATKLGISTPVAFRAIAPTGTIGIMAGTTTGIEPVFAVAYKRRYLKNGKEWHYQYVIDSAADQLIKQYGVDPETIESAVDLAKDYERRIKFQADVQDYVDMAISSTINLPAWGTKHNNEDTVLGFAKTLAKFAPRLRGFTAYPDGSRGGQPLVSVPYSEAHNMVGVEFQEHDSCKGGVCGI